MNRTSIGRCSLTKIGYNTEVDHQTLLDNLEKEKSLLTNRLKEITQRLGEAEGAMQSWSSRLRQDIEIERDAILRQLKGLEEQINEVAVLDPKGLSRRLSTEKKICEGCLVTLDFGGEKETYRLLKSAGHPGFKILSSGSPVGKAIVGHGVGDEIEVKIEAGPMKIKILEVSC